MNKYITDFIRNKSRSILKYLSVPQQKAVSEMIRGLFIEGNPILRHLAQNKEKSAKKQGEKYSYHLGKIDIRKKVESLALKEAEMEIQENTVIAYDLTDISKKFSKKMEKLSRVWDGSAKKVTNGFLLHGIGINNILVKLEVHNNQKETTNQVRNRNILKISKKLKGKGIWVLDRGNDDKQFFKFLRHKANLRFIVRLRENRQVVLKETGDLTQVKNLPPGKYQIYLMNTYNTKVDQNTAYTLVISHHLEEKEPIRLIHNLNFNFGINKIVTMYLERWGVENMFKRVKDKFGLERIRVLNYKKFVTLVALVQLVVLLSTIIFLKIHTSTHWLITGVLSGYHYFIRIKSLTINLESFISFLKNTLRPIVEKKCICNNQLSLFTQNQLQILSI